MTARQRRDSRRVGLNERIEREYAAGRLDAKAAVIAQAKAGNPCAKEQRIAEEASC